MSDLLLDLVEYLTSEGVVQGDGVDTFRDYEPASPPSLVVLTEYAGQGPTVYDPLVHRSVQIMARDPSATKAKQKANEIFKSLYTDNGYRKITEDRWGQIYLRQPPFKIKTDAQQRVYYGFNLGITTYND